MQDDEIRGNPDDPRPVFEGDWRSASGAEKGEHSERVRQWKIRNGIATGGAAKVVGAERGSGSMKPFEQPERHADDLRHLDLIIHGDGLASDRIRAIEAKQRILARVEAEEREQEHGPLVALRDALSALPPDHRMEALTSVLVVEREREGEAA